MRDQVAAILKEASNRAILPRFRRLQASDIIEKSPGEIVTAADRECEALIAEALQRAFPGTTVIGEEGCAETPALLQQLGDGRVWLLDPLDGTANFAGGRQPFAVMLALLQDGRCIASWMLDPVTDRLCYAALGEGAWIDGSRIRVKDDAGVPHRGALVSHFMSAELQQAIRTRLNDFEELPKLLCSGEEYPAIALGRRQASLFWRTLAWDHVPGALFLSEAGGYVARLDGSPYAATDLDGQGLIVAQTPAIGRTIVDRLSNAVG